MERTSELVIGLPRALLYHRYAKLWHGFFSGLGIRTVDSGPTSRKVLEDGSSLAVDEACLSLKVFLGHVSELVGSCDYILVPRISNFGRHRNMCVRFEALYDLTRNVFRDSGQKFLAYNIDALEGQEEEAAFLELGCELGYSKKESKKAYASAKKEEQELWKAAVRKNDALYRTDGLKILIAAHSYVIKDFYIGKPVTDGLKKLGVTPIRADVVNREAAIKRSTELSPTCKWELNREIIGSIAAHADEVDGIILLSAFPCGPDAMVNDLLARKIKRVPLLNLVLDSQTGTAGIETRLESFVDIIRLKKGMLT